MANETRTMHVEARFYGPTNFHGSRIGIFRAGKKFRTVSKDFATNNPFDAAIRKVFPGVIETETVYETEKGYVIKVTMEANAYQAFIDEEVRKILEAD